MEHLENNSFESPALSPVGVEYLVECVGGDPYEYVKDALRYPVPELYVLANVARVFDEPYASTGNYLASDDARAVLAGEIFGMELVDHFATPTVMAEVLNELKKLAFPIGFKPIEHKFADSRREVLVRGTGGWILAHREYEDLFAYWQTSLGSLAPGREDADRQLTHAGFGLIINLLDEAYEHELAAVEQSAFGGSFEKYVEDIIKTG